MKIIPEWQKKELLLAPFFYPLHPVLAEMDACGFPSLEDCNALLTARSSAVFVQRGVALRFVEQSVGKLSFAEQYEPRCYLKGELQMRENNWHDLFNALVWMSFPQTKTVINARHYHALTNGAELPTNAGRGAVRDVNTLLDESGVIVVYADDELAGLLRNFKWKELFWHQRDKVNAMMGFHIFGHGLYEKALRPYVGMTGQGLLLKVEQAFFSWPLVQQVAHLDSRLADHLAGPEHCRSTRDLSPVPLLGVPGWSKDNDCADYYDNTAYFRPGRRG